MTGSVFEPKPDKPGRAGEPDPTAPAGPGGPGSPAKEGQPGGDPLEGEDDDWDPPDPYIEGPQSLYVTWVRTNRPLIREIAKRSGQDTADVSKVMKAMGEVFLTSLAEGHEVDVAGIVKVEPEVFPEKSRRDNRTGKSTTIPSKIDVHLKRGDVLKEALRSGLVEIAITPQEHRAAMTPHDEDRGQA